MSTNLCALVSTSMAHIVAMTYIYVMQRASAPLPFVLLQCEEPQRSSAGMTMHTHTKTYLARW